MGRNSQIVALAQQDDGVIRLAQSAGRFHQHVQHRPHIVRGGGDHAKDVARGGFLSERFLRLIEQSRVLDRDRRLIGEGLQKRLLPVGERPRRRAGDEEGAQSAILPQHRRKQQRLASDALLPFAEARREIGHSPAIGDVMEPAFPDDPAGHAVGERGGVVPGFLGQAAPPRRHAHHVVVADDEDGDLIRSEEPLAGCQDRLEHRRRVSGRGVDDPQHLGGRGLLRDRFVALCERGHESLARRLAGRFRRSFRDGAPRSGGHRAGIHERIWVEHRLDSAGWQARARLRSAAIGAA